MKVRPIKQPNSDACGPTCIKMVSDFFNYDISFKEIEKTSKYKKRQGLTNDDLIEALQLLGFRAKAKYNSTWNDLKKYNTSKTIIIVAWMIDGIIGHFSVLEKIVGNKYIELLDPLQGKVRRMNRMQFMRLWMDYDDLWYPVKNTDIKLRWMCIVSKK